MSLLSKQRKISNRLNVNQSDDRITNLPISLITKILSGLPTKDAVATSVLSTKWKRSWMSITDLDFDDNVLSCCHDYSYVSINKPKYKKFTDFVTRVLLLRERSCLQKVRLKCFRDSADSLFNAWLVVILQCNVQELDISLSLHKEHPGILLPSELILCSTLVVLKLNAIGKVHIPTSACLPVLRTLHLSGVEFDDDVTFTSCFPVLEELKIEEFLGEKVHVVNITSRVLKKLTIVEDWDNEDQKEGYQTFIDTPALEHLYLGANFAKVYLLSKMDNLIEAEIKLNYSRKSHFVDIYSKAIKDFLHRISHVQKLILSGDSTLVISWFNIVLPTFSKLTYLKINIGCDFGWRVLAKFVEKSPCIEILYIQQGDFDINEKIDCPGTLPFDDVPPCFLAHLKEVEIDSFDFNVNEMKVVEYILKNAQVLEKLTLNDISQNGFDTNPDFARALLFLPRTSVVCRIVVQ